MCFCVFLCCCVYCPLRSLCIFCVFVFFNNISVQVFLCFFVLFFKTKQKNSVFFFLVQTLSDFLTVFFLYDDISNYPKHSCHITKFSLNLSNSVKAFKKDCYCNNIATATSKQQLPCQRVYPRPKRSVLHFNLTIKSLNMTISFIFCK